MTSRTEKHRPTEPALNGGVAFVFTCPRDNRVFESSAFCIVENQGVVENGNGKRFLDAKVMLEDACPYCGERHVYKADELPCPF